MKRNRTRAASDQVLSGWKDIANHLGKGIRTVQRYEGQLGLPVRRPSGHPRGSVIATKPEIDAWVEASPLREAFSFAKTTTYSHGLAFTSMKDIIAAMRQLREEMAALRTEFKASIDHIWESMRVLHNSDLDEELRRSLDHTLGSNRTH